MRNILVLFVSQLTKVLKVNMMSDILFDVIDQGYKEYKTIFHETILGKVGTKPWMKHREIEIIEEILRNLKPNKCLEWGTGYSTLYFPKFLDIDAKWISLEHEKDWFEKIKKCNVNPNVEIFTIKSNKYPWSDEHRDGSYSDLTDYIEFPTKFGKFDFILIDGRARKDCLMKACQIISDKGVVILHDAGRTYYHEPFTHFKHSLLFTDYRKHGGIWVGSNALELENVIDRKRHINRWKIINKIGRLFRI